MEYRWLNNGEPDDDGFLAAEIVNAAGNRISTFRAKTEREMIDQLLTSQVHANRRIGAMLKPDAPPPQLKIQPKELNAADRLRLSSEITDPNRVVEAVDEIVTARLGVSPDKLGADFQRKSRAEKDEFYAHEAQAFRDEHPEFYPVPQNRDALFDELKANGWELTRNNLTIAFNTLLDRGDIVPWPSDQRPPEEDDEEEEEIPQPVQTNGNGNTARSNGQPAASAAASPRPRTIASTGLRNSDTSGLKPPPQPRKQKYTRADIERMSRAEFNEKLQAEPDFRRQVDEMT